MPPNLKRTKSGYLFRKVIPKPLHGIIGKTEFKVSCGKTYVEALANYHIESVKAQQIIDAARAKLSEAERDLSASRGRYYAPETYLKPISVVSPELVEQLRALWLSGLEHDLAERAQGLDDDEYDEISQNIVEMQAMLGKAMARGQVEIVLPSLHQLLFLRGYVLALRPEEERRLAYDFLHAVMEGYEILDARHKGMRTTPPVIGSALPEFRPGAPKDEEPLVRLTIERVVQEFLDDYAKRPNGKPMLKKHLVALPLLSQMIGPKRPVSEIRQTDLNRYFSLIQKLPTRWPDVCKQRNISVLQLLENDALLGTKGMARKTFVDGYRASVSSFLRIAKRDYQDQGFPTSLTTEGIIYTGSREDGELAQRSMEPDELKRLFEGPEMRKFANDERRAHQFWLPHIGLFSGARINEVCQINPQTDLCHDESNGIWYMLITDDTEAHADVIKTVKNDVSKRSVPFHPVLLDLGIVDYIQALKLSGATLFFPGFPPKMGRACGNAEVWFRTLIKDLDLRDETPGARLVGYHAFRSTILAEGQEQDVDLTPITGHAGGVIGHSDSDGPTVRKKANRIVRQYQGELSNNKKFERLKKIQFPVTFIKPVKPTVDGIRAQKLIEAEK